ncbi:hypothetical protein [uncultured Sphingobacterium sp.]|uniref:hypothetical protein n=1 Tax=uncultured Sphingobacterium sp. TaxID=182688 RepID=UPI0025F0328A|nr:hypothetical protein [uncultured Sphingobacterium sp.]
MAFIENGNLKGLVGNVVFRQSNEKTIVQTNPRLKSKQAKGTKTAATGFGNISKIGAYIRAMMVEVHVGLHDSNMHNRLITQLQRVMSPSGDLSHAESIGNPKMNRLVNFQFNEKCHLQDFIHFDPEFRLLDNKQLTIQFPKFDKQKDFRQPKNCDLLIINLSVVMLNFDKQQYIQVHSPQIHINLHTRPKIVELEQLSFDVNDKDATTVLVGMNVEYYGFHRQKHLLINNKSFHPAAIVGAWSI